MSNGGNEDEATNEAEETSERLDREMKGYIRNGKIALVCLAVFIVILLLIAFSVSINFKIGAA